MIWDWNGTLLSDIDYAVSVVNRMLVEERLNPTTVDEYKRIFRFPVIDYYRDLGFDISPAKFHELCEKFNKYFYEGLHTCDLWPGARETLAAIKAQGKIQSVLSASEQQALLESVKKFGVHMHFDHVIGIHDKKAASKVERGRELFEKAGVPREQTILIGDTDHDLEVAEALGIEMILVEHGHQCPTRLRDIHHTVLKIF